MKNFEVHGVYPISNCGGLEVHLEEGYDPIVYYRLAILDSDKPQKWHRSKLYETSKGFYFKFGNHRIYLSEVMSSLLYILLAILFSFNVIKKLEAKLKGKLLIIYNIIKKIVLLLVLLFCVCLLLGSMYNPFIYFRF